MGGKVIDELKIAEFRAGFRGRLLTRTDEGYDQSRRVWNAMIDKHPGLIAKCAGAADVVREAHEEDEINRAYLSLQQRLTSPDDFETGAVSSSPGCT